MPAYGRDTGPRHKRVKPVRRPKPRYKPSSAGKGKVAGPAKPKSKLKARRPTKLTAPVGRLPAPVSRQEARKLTRQAKRKELRVAKRLFPQRPIKFPLKKRYNAAERQRIVEVQRRAIGGQPKVLASLPEYKQANRVLNRIARQNEREGAISRGRALGEALAKDLPKEQRKIARKLPRKVALEAGRSLPMASIQARTLKPETVWNRLVKETVGKGKAPGLRLLEATTRPLHATAGAATFAAKGKSPEQIGRAFTRGLSGQGKMTYSDTLKALGVKDKKLRGAAGLGLDLVADPLNVVGFGAVGATRRAARGALRKTLTKTAATGASKALEKRISTEVEHRVARAQARAQRKGKSLSPKNRAKIETEVRARMGQAGLQTAVGSARRASEGRRVTKVTDGGKVKVVAEPGVLPREGARELTIRLGKQRGKHGQGIKVATTRPVTPMRDLTSQVRPSLTPRGGNELEFQSMRQVQREARSEGAKLRKRAYARARAIAKALPKQDYRRVIDAVETGKIGTLPENLRPVGVALRSEFRHMLRQERRAGLAVGTTKDYFPHILRELAGEEGVRVARKTSRALAGKNVRGYTGFTHKAGMARTLPYTQKELRENPELVKNIGLAPQPFSENVPLVLGHRGFAGARSVESAKIVTNLKQLGARVTDKTVATLHDNEGIYYFPKATSKSVPLPRRVTDLKELDGMLKSGESSRLRVLNSETVKRAEKAGFTPNVWDRATAKVKLILTQPNPQYHLTNLYGDLHNAYLGDATLRSVIPAIKTRRAFARQNAALLTLDKRLDPSGAGIKIGGTKVSYHDLANEAAENGAIQTGFLASELPTLIEREQQQLIRRMGLGAGVRRVPTDKAKAVFSKARPLEKIGELGEAREDFVRLISYISARKRGMSPADAASWTNRHHFDYGELTNAERHLRRVFPFYTFTARNVPLQVGTLLARPAKFSHLQVIREEAGKASDLPPGYENLLQSFAQRGFPLPVPGTKKMLFWKPPSTDIGRLSVNLPEQLQQVFGQVNPLMKAPLELAINYNLFFREPISRDTSPAVPAPVWAGSAPEPIKKALHIRQVVDRETGKKYWGWPAKVDYVGKLTPFSATALSFGVGVPGKSGRTWEQQLASWLTGLKVQPFKRSRLEVNKLFDRRKELEKKRNALGQQLGPAKKKDPRYKKLNKAITKIDNDLYRSTKKWKQPYGRKPAKKKAPAGSIEALMSGDGGSSDIFERMGEGGSGGGDDIFKRMAAP